MPHMSSEQLRDLSIKVVEGFLNDKIPLSEGLAKQAAANDLNADQVQRCVEACNTISFLKIMGAAQDRTFEFPLCDYGDVMTKAAMPDMTKVASAKKQGGASLNAAVEPLEKTASEESSEKASEEASEEAGSQFSHKEQVFFMVKEAAANDRAVEDLECRSVQLVSELTKIASEISKDSAALDKIACVVEAGNVQAITSLVFGQPQAVPDFGAGAEGMFKQAELKSVATLQDLYKQAKLVRDELNSRRELQKRAADLQDGMKKQAFLAGAAAGAGRLLGSAAGSAAAGLGRLASAPLRSLGTDAANATKRALGKTAPPKSLTEKSLMGLGTIGLNSTMIDTHAGYSSSGRSRDVWEALQ